jgi:hypothetical protein
MDMPIEDNRPTENMGLRHPLFDVDYELFDATCDGLARLIGRPKSQREAASEVIRRYEDAAIALADLSARQTRRDRFLRAAATSRSSRLLRHFGPQPTASIQIHPEYPGWNDTLKAANADFLEDVVQSGIRLSKAHNILFARALTRRGKSLQSFLRRNIKAVWGGFEALMRTPIPALVKNADFVAAYFASAVAEHPEDAGKVLVLAARTRQIEVFLLLHCLGAQAPEQISLPAHIAANLERLSNHRKMQIEAWKRDPASLLLSMDDARAVGALIFNGPNAGA